MCSLYKYCKRRLEALAYLKWQLLGSISHVKGVGNLVLETSHGKG